jgi:hypothetical protein
MTNNKKILCPNCENKFKKEFAFCPYCGQENKMQQLKFKSFLTEYLSANFNLDSKIIVTLKILVLKPALLTVEFLKGKRTKYVTPVRLYLLVSLVYFFVLSFKNSSNTSLLKVNDLNSADTVSSNTLVELDIQNADLDSLSFFENILLEKIKLMKTETGKRIFWEKLKRNISLGMFVLIPLTAFLFYLLFFRKRKFYIPHLIFTFHLQSLIFLWFTLFALTGFVFNRTPLKIVELIVIIYIIYLWIKGFYNLTVWRTIWKMMLFFAGYSVLIILFFSIISIFSIWLL